jgi:hypothetical protein
MVGCTLTEQEEYMYIGNMPAPAGGYQQENKPITALPPEPN